MSPHRFIYFILQSNWEMKYVKYFRMNLTSNHLCSDIVTHWIITCAFEVCRIVAQQTPVKNFVNKNIYKPGQANEWATEQLIIHHTSSHASMSMGHVSVWVLQQRSGNICMRPLNQIAIQFHNIEWWFGREKILKWRQSKIRTQINTIPFPESTTYQ